MQMNLTPHNQIHVNQGLVMNATELAKTTKELRTSRNLTTLLNDYYEFVKYQRGKGHFGCICKI